MEKVLKYKEREALNTKLVAQAVKERNERKERKPEESSEYYELIWTMGFTMFLALASIVLPILLLVNISTQPASDAVSQQRTADADLISLMTPYEKDAYSAYLRYEQNPTESFVTKSGTHVGVIGVDGCALMWNDSLQEPGSRIIGGSSLAERATYQGFIDHDVNDAGFSRFWHSRDGLSLDRGYLLNGQGCQRNADGLIDGNALKAAAIKASN